MGQARVKRPLRSCQRHHPAPAAVRPSQPELGPHAPLGCPSPTGMRTESSGPAQGRGLRSLVSCHSKVTARDEPPKHTPTSGDGTQGEPCECRVWGTGSRQGKACPGRGRSSTGNPDPGFKDRMSSPPSLLPNPENGAREPLGGSPGVGRGDGASQSWARGSSVAPRGAPSPGRRESPHAHLPVAAQGPCLSSPQTWGQSTAGPTLPAAAMVIGAGAGLEGLLPRLQVGMRAAV